MGIAEATRAAPRLLERIQRDEGYRGIGAFTALVANDLLLASFALIEPSVKTVAILSGFPCLLDHNPPTETDGVGGAFAIARACAALGKKALVLTDECCAEVFIAAAAGCGIRGSLLSMEAFPPAAAFGESEAERLSEIADAVDAVVAIERPGPASDGRCYTMRGRDMSGVAAPLHLLLELLAGGNAADSDGAEIEERRRVVTVGIGDGGNELGMGKVHEHVLASTVPLAEKVACVVPTQHLIVSSVSNWGGYALAACMAVAVSPNAAAAAAASPASPSAEESAAMSGASSDAGGGEAAALSVEAACAAALTAPPTEPAAAAAFAFGSAAEAVEAMLVSSEAETALLERAVAAGARDGVTGRAEATVDGMPLAASLAVLTDLRTRALAAAVGSPAAGPAVAITIPSLVALAAAAAAAGSGNAAKD
ncbi:unnamed protein product [Phaeothamnion confervicola]